MAEPYVGQIISVGFNFAPVGWFQCDGRALPISQYEVLYTLLGTTYGGDGVDDLRPAEPERPGAAGRRARGRACRTMSRGNRWAPSR